MNEVPVRAGALAALGGIAVVLAVAAAWLAGSDTRYSATNSVGPRGEVAVVGPGQTLCVGGLSVPGDTGSIRLRLRPRAPGEARLSIGTAAGERRSHAHVVAGEGGGNVDFPIAAPAATGPATACLTASVPVGVEGAPFVDRSEPVAVRIDGKPLGVGVAVWMLERDRASLFAKLGDAFDRAELFKPGFVSSGLLVAAFLLLPAAWVLGLLALWGRGPAARLGAPAAVGLAAFASMAVWALVTPAFQGPDEQDHASYATHLAETASLPTSDGSRSEASSEETLALEGVNHFSISEFGEARPPWRRADEEAYERLAAARDPARDDGGGGGGAAANGPVYYAGAAAAYKVAGGSYFDRLFAMRMWSALLGALAAAFVCLAALELLPGARWAGAAAGLLVGFQPMFGFISGAVNPDAAVNAAGAALVWLVIRALRRGLTARTAVAIPLVFALGVAAKATMLAFAPALLLALVLVARRGRTPREAWVAAGAALAALAVLWGLFVLASGRELLPAPPGSGPIDRDVGIAGTLSYIWQNYLPPLPFMTDFYDGPYAVPAWPIYLERVWGSFGWLSVELGEAVFYGIAVALVAACALAVAAYRRYPDSFRSRAAEGAVMAVALVSLAVVMHLGLVRDVAANYVQEQGRYMFPGMAALALLLIAACFGFGRRRAPVAATALVAAMMAFSAASQLFVLLGYYA